MARQHRSDDYAVCSASNKAHPRIALQVRGDVLARVHLIDAYALRAIPKRENRVEVGESHRFDGKVHDCSQEVSGSVVFTLAEDVTMSDLKAIQLLAQHVVGGIFAGMIWCFVMVMASELACFLGLSFSLSFLGALYETSLLMPFVALLHFIYRIQLWPSFGYRPQLGLNSFLLGMLVLSFFVHLNAQPSEYGYQTHYGFPMSLYWIENSPDPFPCGCCQPGFQVSGLCFNCVFAFIVAAFVAFECEWLRLVITYSPSRITTAIAPHDLCRPKQQSGPSLSRSACR